MTAWRRTNTHTNAHPFLLKHNNDNHNKESMIMPQRLLVDVCQASIEKQCDKVIHESIAPTKSEASNHKQRQSPTQQTHNNKTRRKNRTHHS